MSGIIDTVGSKSGIVGSDVYPTGHVTNVWNTLDTAGNVSVYGTTGTLVNGSSSIDQISGRKYMVSFTGGLNIHNQGGTSTSDYGARLWLYKHTSAQSSLTTSISGEYVYYVTYGQALKIATDSGSFLFLPYLMRFTFTAGTTDEIFWNLACTNNEATIRTTFYRTGYWKLQFFAMEWMP